MRTRTQARAVKIRDQALLICHLLQWREFQLLGNRVEQGPPGRAARPGSLGGDEDSGDDFGRFPQMFSNCSAGELK